MYGSTDVELDSVDKYGKLPLLGVSMTTPADFKKHHQENLPGIIHGFSFPISVSQLTEYPRPL